MLAHSSLQNCNNSATLQGFLTWTVTLKIRFCFESEGWVASVFWIIVLLHNPQMCGFINYSNSCGSQRTKAAQTVTLPPPSVALMIFLWSAVSLMPDVMERNQGAAFFPPTEYFPSNLGIIHMFSGICETSLFGSSGFPLEFSREIL